MNHLISRTQQDQAGSDEPPASIRGFRTVNRALGDLRRGVPILLHGTLLRGPETLVLLPVETAPDEGLTEFMSLAWGEPLLLLAPGRARALATHDGEQAVATFRVPLARSMQALRALADPVLTPGSLAGVHRLASPGFRAPLPEAALGLAKLARLLPAMLAARTDPGPGAGLVGSDLLGVEAADVLAYPAAAAAGLMKAAEATVPLAEAPQTRIIAFRPPDGGIEHLAIVIGHPEAAVATGPAPLVRVHSECFTGDLLGSLRCDCGAQLHQAIRLMQQEGAGVVLYMAHEGRGIGLVNKLRAYMLQDSGLDTLDANRALGYGADERSFAAAAVMLKALGILRVRLLTNNPDKVASLAASGIEVTGRVSHMIAANGVNDFYLDTKARRFGHLLG